MLLIVQNLVNATLKLLIVWKYKLVMIYPHCFIYAETSLLKLQLILHRKSQSLYQYLSNYIFKPKRYIVDYSEVVLAKMQGIKVGVQLRFGEKQLLFKKSNS